MTKQEVLLLLGTDNIGSDAEKKLERILKAYRDEDIKTVVSDYAKKKDVSLSLLFIPSFFENTLKSINLQRKCDELQAKMPAENETAKSLDILSSALIEAIKQTKGEEIVKYAIDKADAHILEKYPGVLTKQIILENPVTGAKLEEVHHEKLERVLKYVSKPYTKRKNVMLIGPAGTGKNVICEQIAKLLGYEYYQANAVQFTYNLDGFIDANGKYQQTEFYKACKSASEGNDVLFVFDEIDGSNSEVMVRFNDALSSLKMEFPIETLSFKEHMHFMACANTWGTGASFEYVGRNQLDAATLNRWVNIEIDYSPAIEEAICPDAELLSFCRAFRKAINKNHIYHLCTYRNIKDLADMMIDDDEMKTAETLKECLTKNMEANDLSMIVRDLPRSIYRDMVEELING